MHARDASPGAQADAGELFADFTSLAAALATLADAFFRSPRRASFFREPGFAAPDFVLGLGFATGVCGAI